MMRREARVRPEWRKLYPALTTQEWESAVVLADRLLADALLRGSCTAIQGRVLPDAHFDFRGGSASGGERSGMRLRGEVMYVARHAAR
jgi:hypothetical protein